MNSKQNSTIAAKPAIDPALQWIGGAATETPNTPVNQQADKLTKKQADKKTSQPAEETSEPTAMLSARVPASLIKKLRIRAATEDRQIQEIVAELLRDYLEKN